MSKFINIFFFCLLLIGSLPSLGQSISSQNLSNIKVDELSDDQIRSFIQQVEATGLTEAQLEQVASAKGMKPSEIQKLRARVDKIKNQDNKANTSIKNSNNNSQSNSVGRELTDQSDTLSTSRSDEDQAEKAFLDFKPKIFGASLFKNSNLTFEPNLRIATPMNYIIGPDDEITLDINGDNEASYKLRVSPEGTIRIEYAGIIYVSGLTVEQASAKIRSKLASTYPGIGNGRTRVTIGIGNIRSIKVTLIGEVVKPGSYTLPSLATAFNALYVSGGPNENGSFRQIEIIRNNRIIGKLDVYDFLLRGLQNNNFRLQDQDIIRIPTYKIRVEFAGEIKRPALFEVLPNETLADVINFAGGFSDVAYSARIKVLQNTSKERRITDVFSANYKAYKPQTGDKFIVEPILERFENRVVIEGAVFRPGPYELEAGLTLNKLIRKAEGVKEDAFLPRGIITRLKLDNSTELISFDLGRILSGGDQDILLQREDIVNISSIFDLREEYNVSIDGEVIEPGIFKFSENTSVEDLVTLAGGFKEGASSKRIEVSRRIKNSDIMSVSARTSEVYQINVDRNLNFIGEKFILQPFDIVSVRNETGYEVQRQVKVQGEVLYPGTYTITNKDERISDLVKRAGGLTPLAYTYGASLKRPGASEGDIKNKNQLDQKSEGELKLKKLKRLQQNSKDSSDYVKEEDIVLNTNVGINLTRILDKPHSVSDLILEEGDILQVPKQLQTVKISGEVLYPVTTIYNSGRVFKDYVSQAGGFSDRSLKRRSYVIYANGSVKSTKKFFVFNNYPVVKPGAEIFVPKKANKEPLSIQGIVGISTALASLAAIVLTLIR
ncbi:MAG: capsule biosynthesis protein [Sphingobacteriales bacterium]|nr:capsule biosynthesis protein [Sphingobacteriales bacterium]